MFSWRCGETVKVDEQVVLQEPMEVSTPNVQIDIKKGIDFIILLHIKLVCSFFLKAIIMRNIKIPIRVLTNYFFCTSIFRCNIKQDIK